MKLSLLSVALMSTFLTAAQSSPWNGQHVKDVGKRRHSGTATKVFFLYHSFIVNDDMSR